jgi:hypothetical protein
MPVVSYATRVLDNYSNNATVYYDRPHDQATPGTGNTFVLADHNDDQVIIQGFKGVDRVSFVLPRSTLYDNRTHETVAVEKYGQGGGCVLINEDLHCYVSIQVIRGSVKPTELWHIVVSDIILR